MKDGKRGGDGAAMQLEPSASSSAVDMAPTSEAILAAGKEITHRPSTTLLFGVPIPVGVAARRIALALRQAAVEESAAVPEPPPVPPPPTAPPPEPVRPPSPPASDSGGSFFDDENGNDPEGPGMWLMNRLEEVEGVLRRLAREGACAPPGLSRPTFWEESLPDSPALDPPEAAPVVAAGRRLRGPVGYLTFKNHVAALVAGAAHDGKGAFLDSTHLPADLLQVDRAEAARVLASVAGALGIPLDPASVGWHLVLCAPGPPPPRPAAPARAAGTS